MVKVMAVGVPPPVGTKGMATTSAVTLRSARRALRAAMIWSCMVPSGGTAPMKRGTRAWRAAVRLGGLPTR